MFFNFLLVAKLYLIAIFNGRKYGTPLSPYRIFCLAVMVPLILVNIAINWICLALDHVFYPGFRKVKIKAPVFIFGVPRSGATHLHRTMSKDSQFTSFLLWELVFAPSVVQRKLLMLINRLDALLLFGLLYKIVRAMDWLLFKSTYDIRRVSLFENEEDDLLLLNTFSTFFISFMFPYFEHVRKLFYFDHLMSKKEKRFIMAFYKRCIQRHLYFHGPDKIFLSKNPACSFKIKSIQQMCPDVRVINPVRTPMELVPSDFSLQALFFGIFGMKLKNVFEHKQELMAFIYNGYMYPIEQRPDFKPDKFFTSRYDDLIKDLEAHIRHIYATFHLPLNPEFELKLKEESMRSRGYVSRHSYSLEQFGIDMSEMMTIYKPVFDALDFDVPDSSRDYRAA